jgi:hypothetical protein
MRDPSSWVNRTVTVKGLLAPLPQVSPSFYGMVPESHEILYVRWNSTPNGVPNHIETGIMATIHGVIREEPWTNPQLIKPDPNNPGSFITAPGHKVYYIEAEKVELIGPTQQIP